jgi:hypothetical protein
MVNGQHRFAPGGGESLRRVEQGPVLAVEVDQGFEVVGQGLHLGNPADQKIPLGLGHQKAGRFSHAQLFGFGAQFFLVEPAGDRRGGNLLLGAVPLRYRRADIDFHELREVVQRFFGLLAAQLGAPVRALASRLKIG